MRKSFDHFVDEHDAVNRRQAPSKEEFDGAWFNEVFEKTRVRDEVRDQGYGDWMSAAAKQGNANPKRVLNPKCTSDAFNKAFERSVPVRKEDMALIVRPDPGVLGTTLSLTEIGAEAVDNYEVAVGGGLVGYDVQQAHTERRIGSVYKGESQPLVYFDETQVQEQREQDLKRGLTEEERRAERRDEERQSRRDEARRGVQMRIDREVSQATYRANMMMLSR
jgi:hypothetical protein